MLHNQFSLIKITKLLVNSGLHQTLRRGKEKIGWGDYPHQASIDTVPTLDSCHVSMHNYSTHERTMIFLANYSSLIYSSLNKKANYPIHTKPNLISKEQRQLYGKLSNGQ
jgi:hypothetical protein